MPLYVKCCEVDNLLLTARDLTLCVKMGIDCVLVFRRFLQNETFQILIPDLHLGIKATSAIYPLDCR
jgi:hypothetical protein